MNYIEKIYADKAVGVRISVFTGSGGTTEYQAMFTVLDGTAMFSQQLEHIQEAYEEVVKSELLTDAVPLFRRYFLSDAANQSDLVMVWECENSFCALSIVEQAPLNGSKVAMWTWFRTKALVDTHKNGLLLASHNGYTHCWLGGAHNRASNSEYQTRLLLNDYIMQLTEGMCRLSENCIRTWFFVQNIDVNYSGVVRARKDVFVTQGLTEKTHYIASTGIEGKPDRRDVFVRMDAYSVEGLSEGQQQYLYARDYHGIHTSPHELLPGRHTYRPCIEDLISDIGREDAEVPGGREGGPYALCRVISDLILEPIIIGAENIGITEPGKTAYGPDIPCRTRKAIVGNGR